MRNRNTLRRHEPGSIQARALEAEKSIRLRMAEAIDSMPEAIDAATRRLVRIIMKGDGRESRLAAEALLRHARELSEPARREQAQAPTAIQINISSPAAPEGGIYVGETQTE